MGSLSFSRELLARGPAAAIVLTDDEVATLGEGAKRFPIRASVNGYGWRTSVARMRGESLVGLNCEVRDGAGVAAGDVVEVKLELDTAPREVDVRPALAAALARDDAAKATFDGLADTHGKEYARWIDEAQREETRQRRVEQTPTPPQAGSTAIAAPSRSSAARAPSAPDPTSSRANSSPPSRKAASSSRMPKSCSATARRTGVAGGVPVGVVHRLETVEVEDAQSERAAVAEGAAKLGRQPLVERPAVGQPGERVVCAGVALGRERRGVGYVGGDDPGEEVEDRDVGGREEVRVRVVDLHRPDDGVGVGERNADHRNGATARQAELSTRSSSAASAQCRTVARRRQSPDRLESIRSRRPTWARAVPLPTW